MYKLVSKIRPLINPNKITALSIVPRLLGFFKNKPANILETEQLAQVINRLPTWDTVELHGGRTLKGDIASNSVQLNSTTRINRRDTQTIVFDIPRSYLFGWLCKPHASWTTSAGTTQKSTIDTTQGKVFDEPLWTKEEPRNYPLLTNTQDQLWLFRKTMTSEFPLFTHL